MREILFRGKRKDNGEWVEGCYVYDEYQSWIIEYGENIRYEVILETVGQWTEKYDKNKVKIWELGRVKYEGSVWDIEYKNGAFLLIKGVDFRIIFGIQAFEIEVIEKKGGEIE